MVFGCGLAICRHCCRARLISSIKPFVLSLSKHKQIDPTLLHLAQIQVKNTIGKVRPLASLLTTYRAV